MGGGRLNQLEKITAEYRKEIEEGKLDERDALRLIEVTALYHIAACISEYMDWREIFGNSRD